MPYIVCDPPAASEQVKYYTMAGLPGNPRGELDPTGEYGVKYDVTNLAPGSYELQCSACNDWTCSLPSPLLFTVPEKASVPVDLRLVF
jgi:hypothetical protein